MDPYRAALALQHLKPRLAIPIHWGAYHPIGLGWMRPRFLTNPPRLFASFAVKIAPSVGIRILDPGEKTDIEK
jgi:L-ascorbate metabolism protein UlaG (beta-lactamase superfamily)